MASTKLTFLTLLLYIYPVFSAFILMPLYFYPTNWNTLYSSIASNPHLSFTLIIDINNGPGTTQYPDANYIKGLATLNSYPNVRLLGYVYTSYATRSQAAVQADINLFAGWSRYPSADIHIDGIFFDEVLDKYSATAFAYMSAVSSYARSAFPAGQNYVMFNPGVLCDSRYFPLADSVCDFEDYYSSYSARTISSIPANEKATSAFIIHNFSGSQKQQTNLVNSIVSAGIGGLYITTSSGYSAYSKDWAAFVSAMAAAH